MEEIKEIHVKFEKPAPVPDGFHDLLQGMVGMLCESYQSRHKSRKMWTNHIGDKVIGVPQDGNGFIVDPLVLVVNVSEERKRKL